MDKCNKHLNVPSLPDFYQIVFSYSEVESILIPTGEERAIGLKMAKEKMDKSRNVVSPLQQQSEETSSFIRLI